MFKDLKEEKNKSLSVIYKNTIRQWNEIKKNSSRYENINRLTKEKLNLEKLEMKDFKSQTKTRGKTHQQSTR